MSNIFSKGKPLKTIVIQLYHSEKWMASRATPNNPMPVENAACRVWPGPTCHRRFQEWVELDVFKRTWSGLLQSRDNKKGIKRNWQSLDSMPTKSPLGGGDDGSNPNGRGKLGAKKAYLDSQKRHTAFGCHNTSQHS